MSSEIRPKIRRVQVSTGQLQGQQVVVLRDPLGLVDRAVAVPRGIAPLLELCDGTRDIAMLRTALELRTGLRVGPHYVERMVNELDEALLLENQRFSEVYKETINSYRAAPYRLPTLAGTVYSADPELLGRNFQEYFGSVSHELKDESDGIGEVRGLVSPHIDYQRGAAVYAEVWQRVEEAVRETNLVIILGTNHNDCNKLFTLTRQNYFTPWGVLPTAGDVVDELAAILGEHEVFAEELHHRTEHSIEIVAVWLHYLLKERACEIVPVLCGSFNRFVESDEQPCDNREIALFIDALREIMENRRTLIVAAGDLAHVGPAFGDSYPIGLAERAALSSADTELIESMSKGDAEAMFMQVKKEGDKRRICGLPPIYIALKILGETSGRLYGYAQCPADQQGTSFVSICGLVLSKMYKLP